jgi:hypothetical protein
MTSDLDSPPSITFGQVFQKIIPFVLALVSAQPLKCGQTSKQTIYSCKTLLYEKESTKNSSIFYFYLGIDSYIETIKILRHPVYERGDRSTLKQSL